MNAISSVHGRQIFDSRGRPTVEVEVTLDTGIVGRASVPSGASTGTHEAHELRDGDPAVFERPGRHCRRRPRQHRDRRRAARPRRARPASRSTRRCATWTARANLARLGANAVLGTSLAICRASAAAAGQPLYRRIAELAGVDEPILPMPMVNILSGGLHAGRGMDVQDFLAVPVSAISVARGDPADLPGARRRGQAVRRARPAHPAGRRGRSQPRPAAPARKRSSCSPGPSNRRPEPGRRHRHRHRRGRHLAVRPGRRRLPPAPPGTAPEHRRHDRHGVHLDRRDFPIVSIEDALDEEDWDGWQTLTARIGHRVRLVGDDLFTTNSQRLAEGIARGAANGVLVKVNQNGTLTGTLDVVAQARAAGYAPVVSARSGETEDDFLADLAVGTGAGQIKIGSVRNSERLAKYNQLVRIAEDPTLGFSKLPTLATRPLR